MRHTLLILEVLIFGTGDCLRAQEEPVFNDAIRPVYVAEMEYPPLAVQGRIEGVVVIRARLDDQGRVVSASPPLRPEKLIGPRVCVERSEVAFRTK